MKKIINTPNAPTVIGPYSQAILSGNTLYCSGLIAINPITGNLVTDNISAETKQVMKNILAVLKAAEMNFENVVKCTIFMKDMNDYASINEVSEVGSMYFVNQADGVRITWKEMTSIYAYEMINISGKVVAKSRVSNVNNTVLIDNLLKGSYIFTTFNKAGKRLNTINLVH